MSRLKLCVLATGTCWGAARCTKRNKKRMNNLRNSSQGRMSWRNLKKSSNKKFCEKCLKLKMFFFLHCKDWISCASIGKLKEWRARNTLFVVYHLLKRIVSELLYFYSFLLLFVIKKCTIESPQSSLVITITWGEDTPFH